MGRRAPCRGGMAAQRQRQAGHPRATPAAGRRAAGRGRGMTGEAALQRRYRRLLAWYPAEYRHAYGEEMIGVLIAAASDGSKRPGLGGAFDLIRGGLRARLLAGWRTLAGAGWPDALAGCSVAVPGILLGYFVSQWLFFLHVVVGAPHVGVGHPLRGGR